MNHIYKVVWSKAKGCYVVVSELTKRSGKNSYRLSKSKVLLRVVVCTMLMTGCLLPVDIQANVVQGPGASAAGSESVAVGDNAKTVSTNKGGVAIGSNAQALGEEMNAEGATYSAGTIAIGMNSKATANSDIVIGRNAKTIQPNPSYPHKQIKDGSIVIGSESVAYGNSGDVIIGTRAETNIKVKMDNIAHGTNTGQLQYGQGVAIGSSSKTYGTQALAIGADTRAIGNSSLAIGGDDINMARSVLEAAVPQLIPGNGIQKTFLREMNAIGMDKSKLGSAELNTSGKYANTAALGDATTAIGMMSEAFGTGSTAIGINSMTKGVASTGIGIMARSWGNNSVSMGSQVGAYGDNSASIGVSNNVGLDMTNRTISGESSAALGVQNTVYGNSAYAIGGKNTIGSAAVTETEVANGNDKDKIKTVTAGTVKGNNSGVFGYNNTIGDDNSYVIGNNNVIKKEGTAVNATNAFVIGNNSKASDENTIAVGYKTTASEKGSMALGAEAKASASKGDVALGSGSETAAAVGTASATINGENYNFAGTAPGSTVSIGKAGTERTLTNVAAGRISSTSTDAINGSQLYAVTNALDKGVVYAGDVKEAAAPANIFMRRLGEQTNIVGGITDVSKLTDNNLGVVSNGTDTLTVKLAKDLTGLNTVNATTFKAGDTTINDNGVTINNGPSITKNGINAGNKQITNVTSGGTTDSNAANIGDVKKAAAGAKATVTGAKQATVTNTTAADGHVDYVVSATKTTLAAEAGGKMSVTGGTEDANGVIAYTVGLDAATKTAINNIGGGTIAAGNNKTVTGDTVNTYLNNNYYDKPAMDTKLGDKANTNLDNITNAGKTVINDIAADAVKVVNGKNTTVTPGTENGANGTVKTYAVNVAGDLTGIKSISNQQTTPAGGTTGAKITLGDTTNTVDVGGAKITNVADGNVAPNSKDAVNGGQLNEVKELAGKHTIVKVDGQENRTDGNLLITKTDNNGQATYDLKLNDELTVGKTGAAGKDGSIGVKGKDGSAVAINGKDGSIGLNGANGANRLTMKSGDAKPAVDGTNVTRLVLEENGKKYDVATLDDGLQFTGNNTGTVNKHKLNTLVKVQGEGVSAADSDNFASASGNINVKANGTDKLELQLAKNLKNLDSVTAAKTVKAGDAVMGGQTVTNAGGDNETGNYVTGLDNKTWNPDKIVSGRAATEDQVKDAIAAQTATGLKFDANVGGVKTNKLGSTVLVKGEGTAADNDYSGENIKTFITQDNDGNTTINVKMNRSLLADSIKVNKKGKDAKDGVTLTGPDGANGTDGKVGISGKDGNDAVSMSGKDGIGHIGLNGKDGRNADMIVDKGTPDLDGNEITRIKYTDENGTPHEVATKDDGMMYGGDSGTVIKKKLNSQVNVKGGITDENLLTDEDNIGVVSDGNDTLKLRLAKDLQGLKSATFKNGNVNTVINGDGMTITETTPAGNNSVSLTKDGLNNGGKKITNVAEGTDPNDAVNVNQLKKATDAATTTVTAGNNITVTPTTNPNGSTNYEVGLKDQVTLGSDPTKQIAFDGTTGTIKAGDKVTIEGNKGNITAGKVAIDGENGIIKAGDKVTIDGKDGKIDAGKIAVDGKDGYVTGLENKTFDPANIVSGRAATEDQLKSSHDTLDKKIDDLGDDITKKGLDFAGNTGEFHRDLGQKVTIKGEGTEADDKYSGENIKTIADNDGNITIKMAKDIKADSVTANTVNGGTVNADKVKVGKSGPDGVTITGPNGADGTDGKVGVSGKDGKDAVSMSGKDGVGHIGLTGKDGRNADITAEKGDEDLEGNEITRIKYMDENGTPHQVATKDDGMKYGGDTGAVIKKKLNEQVNVVGGISDVSKLSSEDNLGVVSDGTGNLKIRMAKDLKGLESVTTKDAAGNTTVVNGGGMTITPSTGNSVSLTKDGLNNGGNRITNIGPGVNGTDAVNMNQLNGLMGDMEGQIADSGAASAAISGLKPLQYDPLEPTQVMAALGHYKGSTAAALGVAHYTNESTLFHMGVSLGGHDNMFNAGVSYKFGTSDAKKAVPERYKGGPISSAYVMQDEVTALKAKYEKVQRDNEEMKAQIAFLMQQLGNK